MRAFIADYGRYLLLALVVHAVLLLALTTMPFTEKHPPATIEPIASYLYQPMPVAAPTVVVAKPEPQPLPKEALVPKREVKATTTVNSRNNIAADNLITAEDAALNQPQIAISDVKPRASLAERAMQAAANTNENLVTSSYQQFKHLQQQPKITVEKRYQALPNDPAKQVVAKLNNGMQLLRVNGGCRIADPTKDGFDGLMVASAIVPCGDEVSTSALLQQALEKHRKR